MMDYYILYTGILLLSLTDTADSVYCFRKLDRTTSDVTICRGIMSSDILHFPTINDCCDHPRGVAYAQTMTISGRRGKKYYCDVCGRPDAVTDKPLFVSTSTGLSDWGEWTDCSLTCGVGSRIRRRICFGRNCEGDTSQTEACSLRENCPIDGGWNVWNGWSDCTATCGGGYIIRTRQCNTPVPKYGGDNCRGKEVETKECNTEGCPVDGGWSDWITETGCDVTCGNGIKTQLRYCNNPTPQHGGANCSGESTKMEKCDLPRCPMHGEWSFWTRWSECTKTCGPGTRTRMRSCDAPRPQWGGDECSGDSSETVYCEEVKPCPVDGGWSDWAIWSPCFARPCSGEKGVQRKTRDCNSPLPRFEGKLCSGNHTELQDCYNNHGCPVQGGWCDWSVWSDCLQSNTRKFIRRTRECKCPLPENGGTHCRGMGYELESCSFRNTIELVDGSGQSDCEGDDEDCSPEN